MEGFRFNNQKHDEMLQKYFDSAENKVLKHRLKDIQGSMDRDHLGICNIITNKSAQCCPYKIITSGFCR